MASLSVGARDTSTEMNTGGRVDTERDITGATAESPIFRTSAGAAG